ncbi:hypothetical protein [Microbacterium kribbense]
MAREAIASGAQVDAPHRLALGSRLRRLFTIPTHPRAGIVR